MRLTIERMSYGPDAVAHDDNGKTVFVSGGTPGDVVEAEVLSDGERFSKARVSSVISSGAHRVEAPCPYVGMCGGCPWGMLGRSTQLAAKKDVVTDALKRIGRFSPEEAETLVKPIQSTDDAWGYRNKIELAPGSAKGRFSLGMHLAHSDAVVKVKSCPLFERAFPKAVAAVEGALGYLSGRQDLGLERVGIRASRRTKQLEVALWTPTGAFPRAMAAKVLKDSCKPTSVVRVMSGGPAKARRVKKVEVLDGKGFWTERIAGSEMRLSAPSFFQVNTEAAELLIDIALQALLPRESDRVLDLYCGAGTFTLPLAQTGAEVYALEAYGPAVRDLRRNLDAAGCANVEAIGGDAAREFPEVDPDLVLVDPPRAGLAPEVIDLISDAAPRAVVYVSCDPATLARDLARFRERGTYEPVSVTPVDLFPQTYHVETVTRLVRRP